MVMDFVETQVRTATATAAWQWKRRLCLISPSGEDAEDEDPGRGKSGVLEEEGGKGRADERWTWLALGCCVSWHNHGKAQYTCLQSGPCGSTGRLSFHTHAHTLTQDAVMRVFGFCVHEAPEIVGLFFFYTWPSRDGLLFSAPCMKQSF